MKRRAASLFTHSVLFSLASFLLITGGMLGAQAQTNTSKANVDLSSGEQSPGELVRPDCVREIPSNMKTPGFITETSLDTTKDNYALSLGHASHKGGLVLQGTSCTYLPNGCQQCTYCSPVGKCIHYVKCP